MIRYVGVVYLTFIVRGNILSILHKITKTETVSAKKYMNKFSLMIKNVYSVCCFNL